MEKVTRKRSSRRPAQDRLPTGTKFALWVFALLAFAAPLAFGAVDHETHLWLAGLFAIGLLACPPAVARTGRTANVLVLALAAVLVAKEFAPAAWFGGTEWRDTLAKQYGFVFPWSHNPEPGRAVDALLCAVLAVIWFLWVRTLTAHRTGHAAVAWSLFASVVIVAAVSFATRAKDANEMIYGMRLAQGWQGFGPFPNRNHTAALLAAGTVLGCGCIAWAGAKRQFGALLLALVAVPLPLIALFTTHSRGGLVGFAAGLLIFLVLVMAKLRDRRAITISAAVLIAIGVAIASAGGEVLRRMNEAGAADVSTSMRLALWRDTLGMWRDAPLFGHGLGTFAGLFPLYQRVELVNQVVLHPESSWVLWLVEFGAVPLALGVALAGWFLRGKMRAAFERNAGFFLCAAGFAAAAGFFLHSAVDVPAHRWGTAMLALAALAVACPADPARTSRPSRKAALIPAGAALFWLLPAITGGPAWQPEAHDRLITREMTRGDTRTAELREALAWFPLSTSARQVLAMRDAWLNGRRSAEWQRQFRAVARLMPSSWTLCQALADACAEVEPGLSIHYWQLAIERGGHRAEEILRLAIERTARTRGSRSAWRGYAETNPRLLLAYASTAPEAEARECFDSWWRQRAFTDAEFSRDELGTFYGMATKWTDAASFEKWTARHPGLAQHDAASWARLYHRWRDPVRAWHLLSLTTPEPDWPGSLPEASRAELETRVARDATNFPAARQLAQLLNETGNRNEATTLILRVARQDRPPDWFLHKAAWLLARERREAEAVALLLGPSE